MGRYSSERKAAVIKKLLPPFNYSPAEVSRQEDIPYVTVYAWLKQARMEGLPVSGAVKTSDDWSAEAKLAVVIETANLSEIDLSEYCDTGGPSQIVPRLADKGIYIASESSFYRVMKAEGQNNHRGRSKLPIKALQPTTHTATGPNQLWNWDITYLPTKTRGLYYYLYLFEDVFCRLCVAYEVQEQESGEHASSVIQRAVMSQGCWGNPIVLHSDNGAPMKSSTLLAKLYDLGITPSRGRPRVSSDNPYAES